MEGKDLSTYNIISTVTAKPGSAAPGTNFTKWKKGGVSLDHSSSSHLIPYLSHCRVWQITA